MKKMNMKNRKKLIAATSIVALATAGVLSAAVAAFALWNSEDVFAGGRTTAGDLNISYDGGTWRQVTPGVSAPASGTLEAGTDGFITMPGDVIEILVPVTTTLQGENLNATLQVAAQHQARTSIEAGLIAASYRIENANGVQIAPATGEAELGSPVHVPNLESSNEGITAQWTIVVTATVLGDYRWSTQRPSLDLSAWSLNGLDITLKQLREGAGFVTEGNEP